MRNLLEETKQVLEENGKTFEDVKWIGSNDFYIDIDDFLVVADTEYDNGYGGQEVARDLLIVGDDWWLERHEYDGSEWWEYKTIPQKPKTYLVNLQALTVEQAEKKNIDVVAWESLAAINELEENDNG